MGWPDIKDPSLELANSLGFNPGTGIDNTQAFVNYFNYCASHIREETETLYLKAGTYEADYIKLAASRDQLNLFGITSVTTIKIKCLNGYAFLKPRSSVYKQFIYTGRGLIHNVEFYNIRVVGIGATNPNQVGIIWRATGDASWPTGSGRPTGGLTDGATFHNLKVSGFDGEQQVFLASTYALGPLVNQGIEFTGTTGWNGRPSGNVKPALSLIGQMGQVNNSGTGGAGGGSRTTCTGPSILVGGHPQMSILTVSSVLANVFTLSSYNNMYQTGQAFRALPDAGVLPAELSKGVTYYAAKKGNRTIGLATSVANAVAGTLITSTIGTANWILVPLWATAVDTTNDTITFNYDTTLLTDGDAIYTYGTNLPTGLSASTTYYVRPYNDSFKEFQLYDTYAHAMDGGATGLINLTTTGTLTDFGFRNWGADGVNIVSPIDVNLGYTSLANCEIGMTVSASHVHIDNPYAENSACAIEAMNGAVVITNGGEMAGCADGAGTNRTGAVWRAINSSKIVVMNRPRVAGTTDTLRDTANGQVETPDGIDYNSNTLGSGVTNKNSASGLLTNIGETANQIDVVAFNLVYLNGTANVIKHIKAKLNPREELKIYIWNSHADFDNTGNMYLSNKPLLRARQGQVVTFIVGDEYNNRFELVSISSDWNTKAATNALVTTAIDCDLGLDITISTALAASATLATPTNQALGDILRLRVTHDATAGDYLITLPAAFKGTIPTSGTGASGKKLLAEWQWDGTHWMPISTPAWL